MFALVLLTLFASMTAATAAVLADSALRWWSAFSTLRRELPGQADGALPALRPTSGAARPALLRPAALRTANRGISRAA